MYRIISCLNLKGGCGKSTTIVNIGGILAEKKMKPLLIDFDSQQSATRWSQQGAGNFPFPVIPLTLESPSQAKREIERLAIEHKADIVLIDTPPQIGNDSMVAALISDIVLIPVSPSPLDLWAAKEAVQMVKEARAERGGKLPKSILIPSRVINRTTLANDIRASLKSFGEPVSPPVSLRVAIAEAGIAGLPIGQYAPKSPGHKEFINLWKFVNSEILK